MHAKTTIMASPDFTKDRIWLNGKEESFSNQRLLTCINEIKRRATLGEKGDEKDSKSNWKVHICSENNFPTAAGLASSAAGYACLVYCLGKVFGVEGDLSSVARLGSGSACRSVLGGFVRWHKGDKDDGSDSHASQVVPASHWPNLKVLILVVSDNRKKVSSTSGMQQSVKTSELLKHRVEHIVPKRTELFIKAIESRNFNTFAELTMKDSNQFHSVCLDTYPPAVYMNDISHAIVEFVHCYNKSKGTNKVAYTFDAGPNACLFLQEEDVGEVVSLIEQAFPPLDNAKDYIRGLEVKRPKAQNDLAVPSGPHESGLLKYIIHTKIGEGPQVLTGHNVHLLNKEGLPKSL
ncbi:diphosphomevalonate decarboxylase isoform X2 [Cimex lectularius]|nr:diphosphomevalonate decarboxylase isoform X2 [Cimex lectularius]XP_014255367.1 diphosphomevalonate decarboxylase isoform X2 [Cimex lectularius]